MLARKSFLTLACGIAATFVLSANQARAQCMRGGAGVQTGSTRSLAITPTSFNYPSSGIVMSAYPSSAAMAFNPYQQRMLQMQNQMYVIANQKAAEQSKRRAAYEQEIQTLRLARAEATRAKRAERVAALKAKYGNQPQSSESSRYSLASTNL